MVSNNELKTYCEGLKTLIDADRSVYVVREDHLQKKLQGKAGLFLAVVFPSFQGSGSTDNYADVSTCLLYILQNASKSNLTDEEEFTLYDNLQGKASLVQQQLLNDAQSNVYPVGQLELSSVTVDPEWNIAGSYFGYSITFSVRDHD